jgi:hypothetical protein
LQTAHDGHSAVLGEGAGKAKEQREAVQTQPRVQREVELPLPVLLRAEQALPLPRPRQVRHLHRLQIPHATSFGIEACLVEGAEAVSASAVVEQGLPGRTHRVSIQTDRTEGESMNGKGDDPRPTDKKKFDANYERLFGSDEEVRRRRQIYIIQQKLKKVKLDPGMQFLSGNHYTDVIVDLEKQLLEAMGIPKAIWDMGQRMLRSPRPEPQVLNPYNKADRLKIREAMQMPPRRIFPKSISNGKLVVVEQKYAPAPCCPKCRSISVKRITLKDWKCYSCNNSFTIRKPKDKKP